MKVYKNKMFSRICRQKNSLKTFELKQHIKPEFILIVVCYSVIVLN